MCTLDRCVDACMNTHMYFVHVASLQVITRSLEVFGYELMWEHKLVAEPLDIVIFGASSLNHYRLKTLLHILS